MGFSQMIGHECFMKSRAHSLAFSGDVVVRALPTELQFHIDTDFVSRQGNHGQEVTELRWHCVSRMPRVVVNLIINVIYKYYIICRKTFKTNVSFAPA